MVAKLVAGMAAHMNTSHDAIESLGIAGRLHDPGKVGVPDNILLKTRSSHYRRVCHHQRTPGNGGIHSGINSKYQASSSCHSASPQVF
jgi:hypothetical protein